MRDEKEAKKKFNLRYLIIFILFILIFLAGYFIFWQKSTCIDGTLSGKCSQTKPYFCENKILVKKASVCGCSNFTNFTIENKDNCISNYQKEPENITLTYILRGEEKTIDFTVYKELVEYLSLLPISIHYEKGEQPSRADFKLRNINNEEQKELLFPLLLLIQNLSQDKTDRVRIAVSLVQKIPFGASNKTTNFRDQVLNYSRYPYEVLYDREGVCGEKSELLAFLLKEMGYGVVFFYHAFENHESIGIKCPRKNSLDKTGYCFIETTGASIITDNEIEYTGNGKLYSSPEVILIAHGNSLAINLYEYGDARSLKEIRRTMEIGELNVFQHTKLEILKEKYDLEEVYNP